MRNDDPLIIYIHTCSASCVLDPVLCHPVRLLRWLGPLRVRVCPSSLVFREDVVQEDVRNWTVCWMVAAGRGNHQKASYYFSCSFGVVLVQADSE